MGRLAQTFFTRLASLLKQATGQVEYNNGIDQIDTESCSFSLMRSAIVCLRGADPVAIIQARYVIAVTEGGLSICQQYVHIFIYLSNIN